MKLSEKQKKIVIDAGKIELPVNHLAILLDVPITLLEIEFSQRESETFRLYEKSRIEVTNEILLALTEKARTGNKAAVKARDEFIDRQNFIEARNSMFRS